MQRRLLLIVLLTGAALLSGCGQRQESEPEAAAVRATPISAYRAGVAAMEITDSSVGWIDSKASPALTAEVSGRLTQIRFDAGERVEKGSLLAQIDPAAYRAARNAASAEVQRLEALAANQRRQLERHRNMLAENFIAESMYEESRSQLVALQEQLRGAQARLQNAERELRNTRVLAPVSGLIDQRLVAAGDFVQAGQPLARLLSGETLRVHLPFPETVAGRLQPGQTVYLSTPLAPDDPVTGAISELRPALGRSRAVEAIVEFENPGTWRAGASVRGTVVLERRDSVVLPEAAVVMRPAGRIVYLIDNDIVRARPVEVGTLREGKIEIMAGLAAGDLVALDGAGFLTDGAPVNVRETRQ
jgi:RND family efflux transporter MFP subunit